MAEQPPKEPFVAVIVINYNYGRFLADCLESIRRQDYSNLRIVVVDDHSSDDSIVIAKDWAYRNKIDVVLLEKDANRGPAHSYNLAIAQLTEHDDYVCLIDADDRLPAGTLQRQLRAFRDSPADVVVVYGDAVAFETRDGKEHVVRFAQARALDDHAHFRRYLLSHGSAFALNSALIRSPVLRNIPHLDERIRVCDLPLWLSLAETGTFLKINAVTSEVRQHEHSMRRVELLVGDRLQVLATAPRRSAERRAARRRGRRLLRSAIHRAWQSGSSDVPPGAAMNYCYCTHDFTAMYLVVLVFMASIAHRLCQWRKTTEAAA